MKSPDNSVIQIGAWRVDPALDEISRDGQTTKLEPKLMQLLLHLAAHAGQVVSVEQLLDEVWKDVVVTPDSVYHAVAALRRVLGDDSKDPSYIANVMRRGYRLIAPVERQGQAEACAPPLESQHSAAKSQSVKPTVELPQRQPFRKLTERRPDIAIIAIITVLAIALAYFIADRLLMPKHLTADQRPAPAAQETAQRAVTAFAPPPHSIAVLPLVNISGDREQEYFSEGLTEELLNSLSRINELQVAARTSSFSFQGEHPDIATVARKLNVAAVLEGSVRRSGNTVRISVQLVNAVTGFHVWSETYDRDLGDVLKLQTEIATAVASALKVTMLGDEAARIEIGGTRNPAAFDAYLRATNAWWSAQTEKETQAAIDRYSEPIRLDPNFALAYADRSYALIDFGQNWATGAAYRDYLRKGAADARKAIALAPDLADGHLSLGFFDELSLEFAAASQEFQRALELAPGKAKVLINYGIFTVYMGASDPGLAAERRAVMLDPLNPWYRVWLGMSLYIARRYDEAIATLKDAKALAPNDVAVNNLADVWVGLTQYAKQDFSTASATCERVDLEEELRHLCLAAAYNKLGRQADAERMLGKYQASAHTDGRRRVGEAIIYAQWGDTARALASLEAGMALADSWLEVVRTSRLLDPLRNEPRFRAIERALKFPN